jgi:hypothetical protein
LGVPGFGTLAHPLAREAYARSTPLDNAGTSFGELIGWRIWKVRPHDRLLESYSANRIWMPGEPMEGKPLDNGGEGAWAFKHQSSAARKVRELPQAALGSVWLYGDIVEHEGGYRGQYATVRSIDWAGPGSVPLVGSFDHEVMEMSTIYAFGEPGCQVALMGADEKLLASLRARYGVGAHEDVERQTQKKSADPA